MDSGRREPSSSQFGRLIAFLDPPLVDVYGDDVEAMRRRFEDALAQAREAETRARAASRSCAAERGDAGGDVAPPPEAAAGGAHRLSPLLAPRSVALVGASPKFETVGNGMIRGVHEAGSAAASTSSIRTTRRSRAALLPLAGRAAGDGRPRRHRRCQRPHRGATRRRHPPRRPRRDHLRQLLPAR